MSPLALSACADDGYYHGGPYVGAGLAYDGYYDGFYGPIYDGYWGGDGFFYYRHGAGERRFVRSDPTHFRRDSAGGNFQQMHGNFTPQAGMRMPHFQGGGGGRR